MEELDINSILNRNELSKMLKDALTQFDYNKNDDNTNKGIYVYGDTGIGKTKFVSTTLSKNLSVKFLHESFGYAFTINTCQFTLVSASDCGF